MARNCFKLASRFFLSLLGIYVLSWTASPVGADSQAVVTKIDVLPSVASLVRHPINSLDDLIPLHQGFYANLRRLQLSGKLESQTALGWQEYETFLEELICFTTATLSPGEKVFFVEFRTSQRTAIRRLRDEAGIAPPPGGAVVRVYASKKNMPAPIRNLFVDNVAGITLWCRFIAIDGERRSPEELEDIISHELVHAFVCSILGTESSQLPRWFHEGLAIYFARTRDVYTSQTEFGRESISFSPREYNEFRLMFDYLNAMLGRDGVYHFVRWAIKRRSAEQALQAAIGVSDAGSLLERAERWQQRREMGKTGLVLSSVAMLATMIGVHQRRARRRREQQITRLMQQARQQLRAAQRRKLVDCSCESSPANDMVESALVEEACQALIQASRLLRRQGLLQEAMEGIARARELAPWSEQVQRAADDAEEEVNGAVI